MSKSAAIVLISVVATLSNSISWGQGIGEEPSQTFGRVESLNLAPDVTASLKQSLQAHNYLSSQKILLIEVNKNPHSAPVLSFLGGVYFLSGDYWNAAIAWNKAAAITQLPPQLQFSLAMAYVRVGHQEWARTVLELLAKTDPRNSLYPYWMGRLDYDIHDYNQALLHLKEAVRLDPDMARAYDSLGLCYFSLNQNELAVENYRKAIELDQASGRPEAWPYLNLAIALEFINEPAEAETDLRKAMSLDPKLPQAHFQLGNLLERQEKIPEATHELLEASRLDSNYAEPHFVLARIYRKQGNRALSQQEVNTYLLLHAPAESPHSAPPPSQSSSPQNSTRPAN